MVLGITFLIFVISMSPTAVHSKGCSTSFCENKSVPIQYPFQLQGQNQKGCDYLALNLTCDDAQNVPLLNLPYAGDFYVRNINYTAKTIQLHDTNDCLPRRFFNSNASYSPLIVPIYQNYTFFRCAPGNLSSGFPAVACLSNSTTAVLAASSIVRAQEIMDSLGCSLIETVPVPVLSPLQYEYNGFNDDLLLTWGDVTCEACFKKKKLGPGYTVLLVFLTFLFPVIGMVVLYVLLALILFLVKLIRRAKRAILSLFRRLKACLVPPRVQAAPEIIRPWTRPTYVATAGYSTTNTAANNELNIIVVGESKRIPGPNSTDCPICLQEFNPRETMKCITQCKHCFHESCIDMWLRTHNSCPICRNTAS